MREDGCMMPPRLTHGAEASSSCAAIPAPDGVAAHPEQERDRVSAPPAHFCEAQSEQALWQEFCDHGVLLNNVLNEALRIHAGPAWWVFQVRISLLGFGVFPSPLHLVSSALALPLTQPPPYLVC
jgi:hypothetical protein